MKPTTNKEISLTLYNAQPFPFSCLLWATWACVTVGSEGLENRLVLEVNS